MAGVKTVDDVSQVRIVGNRRDEIRTAINNQHRRRDFLPFFSRIYPGPLLHVRVSRRVSDVVSAFRPISDHLIETLFLDQQPMVTAFVDARPPVHLVVRNVAQQILSPPRVNQVFKKWFDYSVDDYDSLDRNLFGDERSLHAPNTDADQKDTFGINERIMLERFQSGQ